MARVSIHEVDVEFGDCDPAGIVFFPNFSRWMDAASHHFFRSCELPPWHALTAIPHCVGAPMLEMHTRFVLPATYARPSPSTRTSASGATRSSSSITA